MKLLESFDIGKSQAKRKKQLLLERPSPPTAEEIMQDVSVASPNDVTFTREKRNNRCETIYYLFLLVIDMQLKQNNYLHPSHLIIMVIVAMSSLLALVSPQVLGEIFIEYVNECFYCKVD